MMYDIVDYVITVLYNTRAFDYKLLAASYWLLASSRNGRPRADGNRSLTKSNWQSAIGN